MPRPRKFDSMWILGVPMEAWTREVLRDIAHREGISIAELVRNIIMQWLETEAKVKYGLEFVFARIDGAPVLATETSPLTKARIMDLQRSFEELKPQLARALDEVKKIWGEYHGLEEEAERYAQSQYPPEKWDRWVVYGKTEVKGEEAYRRAKESFKFKRLRELEGRFSKAEKPVKMFWKLFYAWLNLKKEVNMRDKETWMVAMKIDSEMARFYELVTGMRKEFEELRRALRAFD